MTDPNAFRQSPFQSLPAGQPSLLGKLMAFVVGTLLLVAGFMFSVVALAVITVVGLGIWGWLWWKTRALRRQMADAQKAGGPLWQRSGPINDASGTVIEGEVISREAGSGSNRQLR